MKFPSRLPAHGLQTFQARNWQGATTHSGPLIQDVSFFITESRIPCSVTSLPQSPSHITVQPIHRTSKQHAHQPTPHFGGRADEVVQVI
jgi:hypothetical protein